MTTDEKRTKRQWDCPDCLDAAANHFHKEHPLEQVEDSFYDDKGWTIVFIP